MIACARMSLRPIARASVVQETARSLRGLLLRGHWAVGDRLPPERQLAIELQVNRTSLRLALKQLEHEGLVKSRQGDGTIVLDPMSSAGLGVLAHLLQPGTLEPAMQGEMVHDILEFRRIVGRELTQVAAGRITDADLAGVAALIEKAKHPTLDAPSLLALDTDIYLSLARATRNRVFTLLANSVKQGIETALPALANLLVDAAVVRAHHDALLAALRARDPAAAAKVADAYLARPLALFPKRV